MKQIEILTKVQIYNSPEELNPDDRILLDKARNAMRNAYAPYSKYHVGAAVLLDNGEIVIGSNQENVAYPSGMCAERVAFFAASANFPGRKIKTVVVTSFSEEFTVNTPVTPCGACRQVMAEYENIYQQKIRVILAGEVGDIYILESIESLLPLIFCAKELVKK